MTTYDKPPVQPAWAESGDRSDPPSNAELQEGWPLSNTPPTRQRMNWILNWCANAIRYWMQKGIAEWDAAESYQLGSIVQDATRQTWQALRDNTNATPASSPLDWVKWPDTTAIEADVADAVATANAASVTAGTAQTTADSAQTTANAALPKAGGTMTGPIVLAANAAAALQPTPLQQVQSLIKTAYAYLGGFSNLRGYCTSGAFTGCSFSFDAAVLRSATGETYTIGAASGLTSSATVNAVNGSDGAASAAGQWVYLYVIGGPGKTTGTVWSLSDVAPNLTHANFAGYTYYQIMAPLRQGASGTIVPINCLGNVFYYVGNRASGQIISGTMAASTANSMPNAASYIPPKAISWKPCGFYSGSYSVNQGGSFGAYAGTMNMGRDFSNQAVVDQAVQIFDSGAYTTTCQDQIPQDDMPWFNGQIPWVSFANANSLSMGINMSVASYVFPNGAQ